ncbi:MAG TPA: hypothetical protein VN200_02645 [Rhodoglobus sp.]|nr:hypothetical protein [Rhodoglobus sp.]
MTAPLLLGSVLALAIWIGLVALQLADLSLTASRIPRLSAYAAIRDELLDVADARLSAEQLQAYRDRLSTLDAAEAARSVPEGRSAAAQLWRGTPWRLGPVVLAFVPAVLLAAEPWLALAALVLPGIAYVLALAAARASVAAAGARAAVRDAQRAEIDELLRLFAKHARPPVAGLGDRVRRALTILREQQG